LGYPGCRFRDAGVTYEVGIEISRVDKALHDKLQISVAPDGYLKRVS
jgi:cephalosporin hydroxylase